MAIQKLNSRAGFSINHPPVDLIDNIGNYNTTTGSITAVSGTYTGDVSAIHFNGDFIGELQVNCKNTSGSIIPKGTPVYITGTVGATNVLEVSPANANSSSTMPAVGLTSTEILVGATGHVTIMGGVQNLDTSLYTVGQTVYVAVGGGLTNVKPTGATDLIQNIGRVGRVNQNNGEIIVTGAGRTNDVPNTIPSNATWNGNTITVPYGGTGLTSVTTGDLLYASATNTLNKLTIGSSGQVLLSNGSIPVWTSSIGTGDIVRAISPTLTTPILGIASATSINKVLITAPATGSTLTIADGKTLTVSNTLTFTGTDASSVAFNSGGTVAYTGGNLSQFASTTSSELAGVISDETGSGSLVFATSPSLTTPSLGVATATTINSLDLKGLNSGSSLNNIAIGSNSGAALTTGANDNISIGGAAGDTITSGSRNISIGTNALGAATTSTDCVGIGYQALLLNTANGSVAIGSNCLDALTTGTNNVGIGLDAGTAINTGSSNLAIGTNALKVATTVSDNVAIGFNALQAKSSSGNGNVAIGTSAAYRLTTGTQNTAVGYQALFGGGAGPNTCTSNTAVGYNSMVGITSGSYNSGIGISSLFSLTTGQQNTAVGTESLYSITTASDNTAIGQLALRNVTSGTGNIAIGISAARYKTSSNTNHTTTGNYNVYIGPQVRASGDSVTNEIVIGGLDCVALGSNTTTIGNTSTTANRIYGVSSTGQTAPTIASAATIAPTTSIVFISGTTQINTITAPTLISTTGGQITLIPTGLWTTGTTGNIALASTAVVNRALIMTYDATTTKWYPSY